ncbi:MAG: hypothetical protein JWO38_4205 [Gemmataceae bacterium]|nr:hypothetical protein [Gemmataceae bacterium]
MSPVQVSCPGCDAPLRVVSDMPGKQVRCPKCKLVFAPVTPPEAAAESPPATAVPAVVLPVTQPTPAPAAPGPQPVPTPAATSAADKDKAFFEWLAGAHDPLGKRPELPPKPAAPAGQNAPAKPAELLPLDDDAPPLPRKAKARPAATPTAEPGAKPAAKRARPAHRRDDAEEVARRSGVGLLLAVVAAGALFLLAGLAVAGYVAYTYLEDDSESTPTDTSGAPTPSKEADKPKPEKPAGPLPDAASAKAKAATVAVKVQAVDGQTTTASGFFVPGPGLVVTNARAVGQGRKPAAVSKLQVVVGLGTAEPRTLTAKLLGADPDLDLALLQVTGFDLPDPLPLGDSLAVKERHPVFVFAVPPGDDAKPVVVGNTAVTGLRTAAGTRPWFLLGGGVPAGAAGGPVTDALGRVVGVVSQVPGTLTNAAVPAETVQSFVRSAIKSAEAGGPIAVTPPGHAETDPKPKPAPPPAENDLPLPGLPPGLPGRPGMQPPPRPFDPPVFPPGFPQPLMPQPPVFPQPMPPPGFPPAADAKPPGPPKRRMTLPAVVPAGIKPAPLAEDRVELKLPGRVADACAGGGGRYWILHLPAARQLAVFDVNTAKVVKYIPVAAEAVRFAAGMNKLVVAYPDTGLVTRYDLTTFEKEATAKIPFDGTVRHVAAGAASGGPLLVQYAKGGTGPAGFEQTAVAFLDFTTFKELDAGQVGANAPAGGMGFDRGAVYFRASPDGRVIARWGINGLIVYTLFDGGVRLKSEWGAARSSAVPAEDGTLLTSAGLLTPDLKPVGRPGGLVPAIRVPAQHGPTYLVVNQAGGPNDFRNPNRPAALKLTVHMLGEDRPLVTLPDCGLTSPTGEGGPFPGGMTTDRRILFCPDGKLLGLIAPTDDKLILTRFDLDAEMEKSGIDFLYVATRPPAPAAGKAFKYAVGVKSKKGGVKIKLESGPVGMKVDGTSVVWDVPADWAGTEVVLLTVSDASGQEVFHSFTLVPKGE